MTFTGLHHLQTNDREWMVVDQAGGFLTQRQFPQMALIVPTVHAEGLRLNAPGMQTLSIPLFFPAFTSILVTVWEDNVIAQDCGDIAAKWFSDAIGTSCRLVRFDPGSERMASKKWTAGREVPTLFSDGYPILLTSQASLDDLNQRLRAQARKALPMDRFRPNIVIDGIEAFDEDYADTLTTATIRLQPVKPCPRCPIPSIDQATGKPGPDPLDILQSYRTNPRVDGGITFGMNTILLEGDGEILRVGQEIEIAFAF